MPIKVQNNLPAKYILESENIFVMDENRAISQNIRPLKIVILNLMPLKEDTELDLLRVLSNFPIQTEISFMKVSTYKSTHTSSSHLNEFYVEFKDIEADYFDGLIITGAPVEKMEFSEVDYWEELCQIMDWSKTHVFSTFHICWGAQAGLYHHYGIQKVRLEKKLSGVYKHRILHRKKMLMRGMDDEFFVPQSRYTGVDEEALRSNKELYVVADSEECGSYLILACSSRQIFVTGHSEYDRYDLDKEYKRDLGKGLNPDIPVNYYPDNDPEKTPILSWRSGSNCIYSNWLNFVYQETPFVLEEMRPVGEDSYLREDHSSERDSTISSRRN
ncbi:MAG: homoserine O-succinyltransferase [Oribacterium parvum]|jgi:homoserine O-succinyltransferase|uniref:Homoserine O-acetyltransferase n=2 Tax=Oribacterium parvum TaxID=1501329 RepID=G9WJY3_9FIRM|nr:homoserine O-succinyltransferase [Oribacterium parvum]EHL14180.1 homoserine O-succinyltransferase [Oribacterium parvum ACB1]EJF13739.1 homoserine O-succinyltransferase [Oribacterium parvum ACB8]MBF1268164.1 homoserine O-succinyltransferase [Oribacterium parvum]MBF1283944.1 homoserine O-succinyltransferase [Oribacterium parvum]